MRAGYWAKGRAMGAVGRPVGGPDPGRIGGVRSASAGGQEPPPPRGQPAGWRSDHFSHQGGGGGASGLGGRGGGGFGLVAMRFSPVASRLPRRSGAPTGTAASRYH